MLCSNLHTKTINCCVIYLTKKGCQRILEAKWNWSRVTKRLEWKVTWHPQCGKTKCDFMMNTYSPPAESNFCDEHWKVPKLALVQDCKMEYLNKSYHRMNTYCISRWNWKWMKKLFSHSQTFFYPSCLYVGHCRSFVWELFAITKNKITILLILLNVYKYILYST